MAFANAASAGAGFGGGPTVRDGPELTEVITEQLGFAAINGSAQLRILPSSWPSDALPPPSASLLAVASRKGLLAAGGPDGVYLASTAAIRAGFTEDAESPDTEVRPFTPQMRISYPLPGHVVFSSDESILVVSGQQDGGLDAYQLANLANGQNEPAAKIATNGQSLRALIPNPAPDSASLFAAITTNGELLAVDFRTPGLTSGTNGPILRSGVTCVSWSNKGKQLVVGGADGTTTQMKPDGTVVAQIPKSTSIPDGNHVSGISWLKDDSFFIIYTPTSSQSGPVESSEYYIVTREPKTTNFTFQKLPEVVPPFGAERVPPVHFITRLRSCPPHIQDMLVLSASCSTDISIVAKVDESLASDGSGVGQFALTTIENDARRAVLPMAADGADTTPVGMALDLSSDEKVPNPIPSDLEILETPGPVPGIAILTNEGHLLLWWLIYNDSVRQSTIFSGLENQQSTSGPAESRPTATMAEPESAKAPTPPSISDQNSFSSAFTKPSLSTLGSGNSQSTFGGSSDGTFGKPSTIGSSKASWTSTGFGGSAASQTGGSGFGHSGFGQPGFGTASPLAARGAAAFGSSSALGGQSGGFGQHASKSSPGFGKPAFGAPASGSASASSPFASAKPAASSGFANFSQGSGFGSTQNSNSGASPFGRASGDNAFAQPQQSPFASKTGSSGVGSATIGTSKSVFGSAGDFKLGSSFKGDGTAKDDLPKPANVSAFGVSSLDNMLGEPTPTSPTHDKEEVMSDQQDQASSDEDKPKARPFASFTQQKQPSQTLVTPPSTIGQPKATPAQPVSNLFGTPSGTSTTPAAASQQTGFTFGQAPSTTPKDPPTQLPSTTPKDPPAPTPKSLFGTDSNPASSVFNFNKPSASLKTTSTPKIKEPPASDDDSTEHGHAPEAPLPPDPVSKPGYITGDTSVSSLNSRATGSPDDAPLPPDFHPANKSAVTTAEEKALPSDDEGSSELSDEVEEGELDDDQASSDLSGSAEDVEGDISPVEGPDEQSDQLQTSPESSSKSGEKSTETSPTGGLFTKVTTNNAQRSTRPLFGEIGGAGPIFPPPKPQESPRSPSPVRNLLTPILRADSSRSVSAPAHPRSEIDKRKEQHAQSQMAIQAARAREEEIARQKDIQAQQARDREQAEAEQLQRLEDNEDERLREELQAPVQGKEELDEFVTYQPKTVEEGSKSGIPAQIERLYQDINSMVYTLGMNARSLSSFMKYQQEQEKNADWPAVLKSDTPLDALNDEQVLDDIYRLREGQEVLDSVLQNSQVDDVAGKLQDCHILLSQDLLDLRTKITGIRKSLIARSSSNDSTSASLSADQYSIQQDLRKSSALAQSKLVQIEETLVVLRARLTELSPDTRKGLGASSGEKRKPTVEAVANTIAKMTSMAEKKSADVDVLESLIRKLDVAGTPVKRAGSNGTPAPASTSKTPGSTGAGSVYHTPNSKFGGSMRGSTKGTPSRDKDGIGGPVINQEDRERWIRKARRKREVADVLVGVLAERRKLRG